MNEKQLMTTRNKMNASLKFMVRILLSGLFVVLDAVVAVVLIERNAEDALVRLNL